MEHASEMVKEYATKQEYHTDEQLLGREGWSVKTMANRYQKRSLIERIRARFSPKPANIVVTYSRERPS